MQCVRETQEGSGDLGLDVQLVTPGLSEAETAGFSAIAKTEVAKESKKRRRDSGRFSQKFADASPAALFKGACMRRRPG